jgi:hypothetical protein
MGIFIFVKFFMHSFICILSGRFLPNSSTSFFQLGENDVDWLIKLMGIHIFFYILYNFQNFRFLVVINLFPHFLGFLFLFFFNVFLIKLVSKYSKVSIKISSTKFFYFLIKFMDL